MFVCAALLLSVSLCYVTGYGTAVLKKNAGQPREQPSPRGIPPHLGGFRKFGDNTPTHNTAPDTHETRPRQSSSDKSGTEVQVFFVKYKLTY